MLGGIMRVMNLQFEDSPEWYFIAPVMKKQGSPKIRIVGHLDTRFYVHEFAGRSGRGLLEERSDLPVFQLPHRNATWGFRGGIRESTVPEGVEWLVELPRLVEKDKLEFKDGRTASANLHLLFESLALYEGPFWDSPQLIGMMGVGSEDRFNGGAIHGYASPEFARRLTKRFGEDFVLDDDLTATVSKTVDYLLGGDRTKHGYDLVEAGVDRGRFFFERVWGSVSSLPERRGEGYQFSSHNVDNPLGGLSYLMGLARLEEMLRTA